jgi:nucleotide-binding universal stress UspA family protein
MATVPDQLVLAVTDPGEGARCLLRDTEADVRARGGTLLEYHHHSTLGWSPGAIAARARAVGAELIVVCDPGGGPLASWRCSRLIHQAHCNVLFARPHHGDAVLIAVDLEDPSLDAIWIAAREASLLSSPVVALNCHGTDLDGTTRQLSNLVHAYHRDAEVTVVAGAPAATIVNAAAGIGADLVVIATHGRTGLGRWLHPSVAEAVVRRAPCSVLVVRHERGYPLARGVLSQAS